MQKIKIVISVMLLCILFDICTVTYSKYCFKKEVVVINGVLLNNTQNVNNISNKKTNVNGLNITCNYNIINENKVKIDNNNEIENNMNLNNSIDKNIINMTDIDKADI